MSVSPNRRLLIGLALLVLGIQSGCVTFDLNLDLDAARTLAKVASFGKESQVSLRKTPKNPLAEPLNLIGWGGPKPTERTEQLLRRFDLNEAYEIDPEAALLDLHQRQIDEPSLEKLHALAQLCYIQAAKAQARSKEEKALDLYASTIVYAYRYLFDPQFNRVRNEFDPEFRSASELYNVALEGLLRQLNEDGNLRPGYKNSLAAIGHRIDFTITLHGPWHEGDFERIEFASDYEVNGLNNTYHTYGLGVPLIAVRKGHDAETPEEQFYPKNLTFPVTAFLHVLPTKQITGDVKKDFQHCAIELHDPMRRTQVELAGRSIPLESDITTPLAYYLNDPLVSTNTVATLSLLNAEFGKNFRGLYMLEPYDPNRIPVVMVHGLWSSPVTWMEMFNDLRSLPEIRENYQFWFYMYPTGQPFWISADQMRNDLARATQILDPYERAPMMQQMVLVGHSMGGLVSRMQTVYSKDDFWSIMSEYPIEKLQADEATRDQLSGMWFFDPNPSVRRVITIGTPHRGSEFANSTTKWLGRSFFTLPQMLMRSTKEVIRDNPEYFQNTELITMTTSVDSLAPDSPVLPVLLEARSAPWVTYHNIVGVNPNKPVLAKIGVTRPPAGDGVVSVVSATMDNAASVVEVPAAHTSIHQHPRAILEVRRILLEHLGRVKMDRTWDPKLLPASHEAATAEVTQDDTASGAIDHRVVSSTEPSSIHAGEDREAEDHSPTHVAISDLSSRASPTNSTDPDLVADQTTLESETVSTPNSTTAIAAPTNGIAPASNNAVETVDVSTSSETASPATSTAANGTPSIEVEPTSEPPSDLDRPMAPDQPIAFASSSTEETADESSLPQDFAREGDVSVEGAEASTPTLDVTDAGPPSSVVTEGVSLTTTTTTTAANEAPHESHGEIETANAYPSTGLPAISNPDELNLSATHSPTTATPPRHPRPTTPQSTPQSIRTGLSASSPSSSPSSSLQRWSLFSGSQASYFDVSEEQRHNVKYAWEPSQLQFEMTDESRRVSVPPQATGRSSTETAIRASNVFVGRPARFDAPLPAHINPTPDSGLEPGFANRRTGNQP